MAVDKEIMRSNPLEDIEYEKVKRNVEIRYLTREQVKMAERRAAPTRRGEGTALLGLILSKHVIFGQEIALVPVHNLYLGLACRMDIELVEYHYILLP